MDRLEMMCIHIEEAFLDDWNLVPMVVHTAEDFDYVVRGRPGFYYDRGIIPFSLDAEANVFRCGFYPDIILAETACWDDQLFLQYIMYWTVRLKMRLAHQGELYCVSPEPNETLLEEMVDATMISLGFPEQWPLQIG